MSSISPHNSRSASHAPPAAFLEKLAALDREPIVITGTSGRAALLLAACVVFVVLGGLAIVKGEADSVSAGIPAVLIFGLGVAIAIAQIVRPAILTITPDGVRVRTLLRTWAVRWDEVTEFFVLKARATQKSIGTSTADMAAFNRIDPPRASIFMNRAREADGAFGPGWPLSAAQMTALLNAARARSLAGPQPGTPPTPV